MRPPSHPSPQQQAELVEPFVRAIRDVFKKMTGIDPTIGRAYVNPKAAGPTGVCGVIEFYGQVVGSVAVRFSAGAAGRPGARVHRLPPRRTTTPISPTPSASWPTWSPARPSAT